MLDLDKIIYFSCPEECGQLAAPCSLRMILNNEVFFCEACGCEFQASVYPNWQSGAMSAAAGDDADLKDTMAAIYSYLYANGPCPAKAVIRKLLQADWNLWPLFPLEKIAAADILKLIEKEEIAAVFDFASLNNEQITEVLIKHPVYADKCDFSKLLLEDWLDLIIKQPQLAKDCPWDKVIEIVSGKHTESRITQKNSKALFKLFAYRGDSRFKAVKANSSARGKDFPGSAVNFWATVNYFGFYPYIDWSLVAAADVAPLIRKYPCIIEKYPFDADCLTDIGWNFFTVSDWEAVKAKADIPECLMPIYKLGVGKDAAAILKAAPQLRSYCHWEALSAAEWTNILITFPDDKSYCECCDWSKLKKRNWDTILRDGKNKFAIAFHDARQGKNVGQLLKSNPEVKPYVAWDKIPIPEWFDLLAGDVQLAAFCSWGKVYEFIMQLPPEKRQSIQDTHRGLWEKRVQLMEAVDFTKLQRLAAERYYAILDFFDWEEYLDLTQLSSNARVDLFSRCPHLCERYGFDNLSSREKVKLAIKSPDFLERYGWKKFSTNEAVQILQAKPELFSNIEGSISTRSLSRQLADTDERFAEKYKLDLFDYLFFRKFKSDKLNSKVTFAWHFAVSMLAFAGFWHFLYDGPCGFEAYYKNSAGYGWMAAVVYWVFAALWSCMHSRLFSGQTPFFFTIVSAAAGGGMAAVQYGYTFFLSKISLSNYICWGVIALLMLILAAVKASETTLVKRNIGGLELLMMVYVPILLLTVILCQPFFDGQFIKLGKQLAESSRPFPSAANYYLSKAFALDSNAQWLTSKLESPQADEYEQYVSNFDLLQDVYGGLPEMKELEEKLRLFKQKFTQSAVEAYERQDYKYLAGIIHKADPQDAQIQFIAGKCFHLGLGGHKVDYSAAAEWYRKAVSQKHPAAMVNLGNLYWSGQGMKKNAERAFELYRQAAEYNLAVAQHNVGLCYLRGNGVKQNSSEAVKWFRLAAEQEFVSAQAELGKCYYNGAGVDKDYKEAVKWLSKAADKNNLTGQLYLGLCCLFGYGVEKNYAEAERLFYPSAEKGEVLAQTSLGACFFNERKYEDAVKWLSKAAAKNNAQAQELLGVCYLEGYGVAVNQKEAVKWIRKAAEQGFAVAQTDLGVCYYKGLGVSQNYNSAVHWYRKAAEQGNSTAQCNLGVCYFHGRGVLPDQYEAVKWFRKAAELGDPGGTANLGICYFLGSGVEKNHDKAMELLRKAESNGNENAKKLLKELQK